MRFRRLQIPAFGPFTNLDLEFRKDPGDLHVIYGPNEAGKSSLLRAIRDLLFGIPVRSPDDFLHKYSDLRIRAEISKRSGETLVFQRRKAARNTLQDGEGNVLPDTALGQVLGSVDCAYFSAMFGLGASELHDGAQQLLRGEGELGQALFSASLGGTPIQKVLESLRAEAERLYKPRATVSVTIRPSVTRYKELLKQSREAMVNPETWITLAGELAAADAQKRELDSQISTLNEDLARIERCEGALPIVGRLAETMQKLSALPALPELASDFPARAREARGALAKEQADVQRLTERHSKLQLQLAPLPDFPTLLGHAEVLERLHQDLGAYRAAKRTFDELNARIAGLELLLRAGMVKLELTGPFESLSACRLSSAARLAFEAAAHDLRTAQTNEADQARKIKEVQEHIHDRAMELETFTETNLTQLREALSAAESAIDPDRTLTASQTEVKRLHRETASEHHQIFGAPADFDATAKLPVPTLAAIRQHKEKFDEGKRDLKALESKLLDGQARCQQMQTELGQISRQGALPSEDALRKARAHRDHGWSLVLAHWKGPGTSEEFVPGTPLDEAFPKAIRHADDLADALRQHADAVAQAEQKRSQIADAEKQIAETKLRITAVQHDLEQGQKTWESEWTACAIVPRSPEEMIEWRDHWMAFKERLGKLRTSQEALESKSGQIQQACRRLAGALSELEEKEFSILFQKAKAQVQQAEVRRGRRDEIAKQLDKARKDLAKLDQSRASLLEMGRQAAGQWRAQCQALGLAHETAPDAGLILLQERRELVAQFDQWQEMTRSRQLTAEKIRTYEQAIEKCADTLGISGDSTEALESDMWKALTQARKVHVTRAGLIEQIGQINADLSEARSRLAQSEQAIKELVRLAHLASSDDLEEFLAHLEQRDKLHAQISQLRCDLVGLAGSSSVDDFIAQVRAQNLHELSDRKAKASQAKNEHESALALVREKVFQLANQKRELEKAGDAAADYRQQAELCAAALREQTARYLRLRLSTHFLEVQIERFRKENQGPLLQRTGELFSAITQGAFRGLAAEVNADDIPVLAGLRPNGEKVLVDGLSQGTRDQLYLALRLAALERHLQEHEPMPLILDDLLITFDDHRARAILPPLLELAKRTQIFLFTHHQHLVEICRQSLGESQFQLHPLES